METKTFGWNYFRLTWQTLLILVFVAGGILLAFDANNPLSLRALMILVAAFGCLSLVVQLRTLFSKGPAIVIARDGIQLPNSFSGTIPWTQITTIMLTKTRRNDFLGLTIDDTYAKSIKWFGLLALWIGRHPKSLSIVFKNYNAPADEIVHTVSDAWTNGRQTALESGATIAIKPAEAYHTLVAAKFPIATYGLIALFVVVYICELYFAVNANKEGAPSTLTLVYLGGDLGKRVKDFGEYWRMFTAPLMHASPLHIILNSFVFWWAGKTLERIAGWKWLLGTFVFTALGGEIASNLFLAPNIVSVGASGGVMGVLAALIVSAGRLPTSLSVTVRSNAARWLIPSLLPFLSKGENTNYFAHGGGAVVGVIVGLALLKLWPRDAAHPPFANAMAIAAFGFFALAAYAIYPIMKLYGH